MLDHLTMRRCTISPYYKKISPLPPPPCQESKGWGGRGGGVRRSQGRIILSLPKARNFWVCSKFGFVRSLVLFEVWVFSKFGFVRSLSLFDSNDPLVYTWNINFYFTISTAMMCIQKYNYNYWYNRMFKIFIIKKKFVIFLTNIIAILFSNIVKILHTPCFK